MYTAPPLLFLALALIGAPSLSLAFTAITTDSTIIAGKDTTIHFVNDPSSSSQSSSDSFDRYRVYLSLTPPGLGSGPACYLVNSSAINVTSQTIQIPASVGPSDRASQGYAIAAIEFYQDPSKADGSSGLEYSSDFDFVGGTGNWSAYELAGYSVGLADATPCSAYDCARGCSQKYYPRNVESVSSYRQTYECIAACPGATYPPFDSLYGGGGGGRRRRRRLGRVYRSYCHHLARCCGRVHAGQVIIDFRCFRLSIDNWRFCIGDPSFINSSTVFRNTNRLIHR